MENSGVGLDYCVGGEDGSPRLESSPHGLGGAPTSSDHNPSSNLSSTSVDHHHVALATAKIIKENTLLLPNGKIKHRSGDENGLIINHHVITSGSPSSDNTSGLLINNAGVEVADKYERFPTPNNASSGSNKTIITNNQTISNRGGNTHENDDDDEDDDKKPLSASTTMIPSRTYQQQQSPHGDHQMDSLTRQIDTFNISTNTPKDNNTSITVTDDTATNIINNTGVPCCSDSHHGVIEEDNNCCVDGRVAYSDDDDDTAGLPSYPSSSSLSQQTPIIARADSTGGRENTVVVTVNNDSNNNNNNDDGDEEGPLEYRVYECELQMADIMRLITRDLSEPYSIYTYRYFIHNWPKLCFLCMDGSKCVGAIVCKLDIHKRVIRRGYIAMLAVDAEYRRRKIGSNLVLKAIRAMLADGCDEVVLETEITNKAALKLYENLGFVRDKRLFRYYLNGVDALRLKLWLR